MLREIEITSAKMINVVNGIEIANNKDKTKIEIAMADKMIEMIEIKEMEAETEKIEVEAETEVETKIEDMEVSRVTATIHNHNNNNNNNNLNRMVDITEETEVAEEMVTTIMVIAMETTTKMNRIIITIWFKHPNLSKRENLFLSLLLNQ